MEEDIKILKEKIKQWQPYKNRRKFSEIEKEIDIENQAIENILNRLEQLEKENEELKADNYSANCIISDQIDLLRDSIPKSKIIEKIEEMGEKQKATKDMCKSLALSTARTTLAELIGLDNMVNLFQGCDTLIKLNESGGSNE